ncbi:DEAD/DEAH box helicase family protein [Microbacteriaceae bacterium VKM Ac-2855]|nr:DEAD/DEAH box helicase family protein [Microbacteriaceae bacterium VKM Ac-2855]
MNDESGSARRPLSNFEFLHEQWRPIALESRKAERLAIADPRLAVFSARRAIELAVRWMYRADRTLMQPYKDDLIALINEPTFKQVVGQRVQTKLDLIRREGNLAVHGDSAVPSRTAQAMARELFDVLLWLARTYAPTPADRPEHAGFDISLIPVPRAGAAAVSREHLTKLDEEKRRADAELERALRQNDDLLTQIEQLQLAVAAAKPANESARPLLTETEAQTRDEFIDLLLKEAGWALDGADDIEYPIDGMPGGGRGFVDYVLWGADGRPLAVVEAKRTRKDPHNGEHQARLYADALEAQFARRPVIFTTNGVEHHFWDDLDAPPRTVSGFFTRDELELIMERRTSRAPLSGREVDADIAGRYYQQRAVRKVAEAFEAGERRALLVMATGSGKTRTVIALADLMIQANWAKNILFLADRRALVKQAANAFKAQLPNTSIANLVEDRNGSGRVMISTYPTMMGLINESTAMGQVRRFGPGAFDLIVVDEAHRSIYQKYKAIFSWFDARVVGLTATPRDEVDHDTYRLFGLEDGVPTDAYELADAIAEGWLVPPVTRVIESRFVRQGVRYDELSESDQAYWDEQDWDDTGEIPDVVEAAAVNAWLFNADTVDRVLAIVMSEGRSVAGGDRLGKTIVFARNQKHAWFIKERFDANYPEYKGTFADVIAHEVSHAESLLDTFEQADKRPQIAISVDMLDTGVDVPDVVNLVFFKQVFSKTKFWQMVGRGTRLRPELYGPGDDKRDFLIFDVGGNIDYFNADDLPKAIGSVVQSLRSRLFVARLGVLAGADALPHPDAETSAVRAGIAATLHRQVAGMRLENILVRPHRNLVEHFGRSEAWGEPTGDGLRAAADLADLPSSTDVDDVDEQAKRFDLLVLRSQLGALTGDADGVAAAARIRSVAASLLTQSSIPAIKKQAALLELVAGEEWWIDVTVAMLESARIRLRDLVRLLERGRRNIVYADFTDDIADVVDTELKLATVGVDRERFRQKLFAFLAVHSDDAVLFKLRNGRQLTRLDLAELQRILIESGEVSAVDLEIEAGRAKGLGVYIRSIVGLERSAVAEALSAFTASAPLTGNQIAFVEMLTDQLTRGGVLEIDRLYQPPFSGVAPQGPEELFSDAQIDDLEAILRRIRESAEPRDEAAS